MRVLGENGETREIRRRGERVLWHSGSTWARVQDTGEAGTRWSRALARGQRRHVHRARVFGGACLHFGQMPQAILGTMGPLRRLRPPSRSGVNCDIPKGSGSQDAAGAETLPRPRADGRVDVSAPALGLVDHGGGEAVAGRQPPASTAAGGAQEGLDAVTRVPPTWG